MGEIAKDWDELAVAKVSDIRGRRQRDQRDFEEISRNERYEEELDDWIIGGAPCW